MQFDATAISLLIQEGAQDGRYRPSSTVTKLSKGTVEYQTVHKWDVAFSGATVSGRAVNANPSVNNPDNMVGASLGIGDRVLSHTFSVLKTRVSEVINAAPKGVVNGRGIALRNLYKQYIDSAFDRIFFELDKLIFSGIGDTASHGIFGLNFVADPANISYAGISSATYPEWLSDRNHNATARPLTRALFDDIRVRGQYSGMMHEMILTSPKVAQNYKTLFATDRSLTTDTVNGRADIGFTGQSFEGIEIHVNPNIATVAAAAAPLYFLDTNHVELISFDLTNAIAQQNRELQSSTVMIEPKTGLSFFIGQLPANNPLADTYEIGVMPQLVVRNRSKGLAVITNVTQ